MFFHFQQRRIATKYEHQWGFENPPAKHYSNTLVLRLR